MTDFQLDGRPPHQRQPTAYPWGFFLAWSVGDGGAQSFHWFASEQEALNGLRDLDAQLFTHALEGQPETEPDTMRWLLAGIHRVRDVPVERLNALQSRATLRWIGHRTDLLTSPSRFAREIRRDFVDHWEDAAYASDGLGSMAELFDQHLLAYANRFPEVRYVSPYRLTPEGGKE